MTKKLLIDASHAEETRVVVLDGNRLEDFDVETATRKQIKGNIYLAKVIRVEPSLQAAFVEYGGNRHGFLAFGEIHPDYYQIPVADRQKLLKLQAEDAAREEREESETEAAPRPPKHHGKRAQKLDVTPIEIAEAPPPEGETAPLEFEEAGETPPGDPVAGDADAAVTPASVEAEVEAVEAETAETEAAQTEVEYGAAAEADGAADDGADGAEGDPDGEAESGPEAPAPENLGGDGDDAAEARERRQRQRFLRNYKIQEVIHRRQIMLIQVVKEERGNKGAALTTYLSLAGRFSVLMPNSPSGGGVSRKITSPADRRRLKEAMAELDVPEGMGLIVRTAGANRPKPEIVRDCEYLLRLWDDIRERTMQSTAPALIYEEASLIKRTIRDVYTRDIDDVLVDGEEGFRAARDFMRMLMPSHARKVQLWIEGQPLFAKFQVEAQLDAMLNPIVQLRSGGYIVINQTEALVAIDVNSGRSTRERSIEDTALRTNLEAADEVARQVRMRDLAGLIVIDFIDMESRKNNAAVERRMKDALKNDRARIQVGSISHFGLMEMSRQRLRPSLAEASLVVCPHCAGMGQVRSPESAALHILRAIEDEGAKFRAAEIAVVLPPEIALYLFNHKRERLSAIEARYAMRVTFNADPALTAANFRIEKVRAQTASALPAPASYGGVTERAAVQSTGVLPAAAAVVEAEEAEAEDEDEAVAPAGETAEEAGERKRKRRRRRGKRRPEGGESAAGAPVAEAPPADEAAAPGLPAEAPSELDLELAARFSGPEGDMPAGDSVDKVRRRRGRGGRRRRGEEAPVEQDVPVYADVAELFEAAERAEAALRVRAQPVREEYPVVEPEPAPEAPVAEALEGVAAVTVSTEAEAEQAEAEKPKPVWAPKVIGEDEPVAEKKRGWWRR
jgi:ribonuclease E